MSKNKDFERIDSILNRTIKRLGFEQKITETKIISIWEEIIGEQILKHTKPLFIHKGVLFIETDNPVWCNEIGFFKERIKEEINNRIGNKVIKKIYLKVKKNDVSTCRLPSSGLE